MTIVYQGIRRKTTDVLEDYGQAQHLVNVRLKRVGELGRRAGLGKSTMAQLAGPVQFMIGAWSNEPFIVNGTGGDVTGNSDPLAKWTGATMRIPGGVVGQPVAPNIISVSFNPTSPPATYPIASVQMTATYTYDNLSGPLIWSWPGLLAGGAADALLSVSADNIATYTFGASCIPGAYNGTLQVNTTLGGFSDTYPVSYAVL